MPSKKKKLILTKKQRQALLARLVNQAGESAQVESIGPSQTDQTSQHLIVTKPELATSPSVSLKQELSRFAIISATLVTLELIIWIIGWRTEYLGIASDFIAKTIGL